MERNMFEKRGLNKKDAIVNLIKEVNNLKIEVKKLKERKDYIIELWDNEYDERWNKLA